MQSGRATRARHGPIIASFDLKSRSTITKVLSEAIQTVAKVVLKAACFPRCRHRRRTERNRDDAYPPPQPAHRWSPSWACPAPGKTTVGAALAAAARRALRRRRRLPPAAERRQDVGGHPARRRRPAALAADPSAAGRPTHAATGASSPARRCSRWYRDVLREAAPGQFFVHLDGRPEVVARRVAGRPAHFMPASLSPPSSRPWSRCGPTRPGSPSTSTCPSMTSSPAVDALTARGVAAYSLATPRPTGPASAGKEA